MKPKKISIVTPSFNQAEFLEDAIQSVVNQGYPNLEYVIIDGGSSDSSVEIIKKYEKDVTFWVSEKDEGHGHALNKGFAQTSGEIMAWINSDDKYLPWTFEVVNTIFEQFPHVMWIMGLSSLWNRQGAMTQSIRTPKNIYDFLLGNYKWIQQESVFWRRELWDKSGGFINQDYKLMIDCELWTRFFLYEELYTVDCILGGFRKHSTNRSTQFQSQCTSEITNAISSMKEHCSDEVLSTYEKLERLRKITNKLMFESRIVKDELYQRLISSLGRKWLAVDAFEQAVYKNICYPYHSDHWSQRTLAFLLY